MSPHRGTLARRKMMRRTAMAATIHRRVVAICVVLGLIFAAALVRASAPEQDVPAQLKPAGGRALVAEAHAKGFQVYTCKNDGKAYIWALKGPEAELLTSPASRWGGTLLGPCGNGATTAR